MFRQATTVSVQFCKLTITGFFSRLSDYSVAKPTLPDVCSCSSILPTIRGFHVSSHHIFPSSTDASDGLSFLPGSLFHYRAFKWTPIDAKCVLPIVIFRRGLNLLSAVCGKVPLLESYSRSVFSSFVCPNIFRRIFLSETNSFPIIDSLERITTRS